MKLRLLTAVAVLVSGAVHLWLWYDVFRGETVVGPMFLLNVAASIVIATLLLRWRHWLPAFLAAGFGASTLGAFLIATTSNGLFGVHEKWTGGWVFLAAAAELVAIIGERPCCCASTRRTQSVSSRTGSPSAVRISTEVMSERLAAVAAASRIVLPGSDFQVATRSVRPSLVCTTSA